MALTKPPVLPAWAEAGDKVQPSNAEIQAGWPLSNVPPSRQRFNWLLNFLANGIRYLTRRGLPDWGADETYMISDRVIGDDGKTYRSIQDNNTNHAPSASPLWWEEWAPSLSRLADLLQKQTYTAFTTAGAAPNFTLTPAPAITAYTAGQRFRVNFHAAGAGANVLNVSGLGNKSLKQYDSTGAKVAAVIAANQLADVEYDGVDMLVLDPLPSSSGATPPQFDNDSSLATTEFVQRALGSTRDVVSLSANTTLDASHVGKLIAVSAAGGYTLTLPSAATLISGASIEIFNGSGSAITVSRAGADTIWADTTGYSLTSITVGTGDTIRLQRAGAAAWVISDGSAALKYSSMFGSSLTTSGYQRLPSGLIVQWGSFTTNASGDASITFPIAFPNQCNSVQGTYNAGATGSFCTFGTPTTTGVAAGAFNNSFTKGGAATFRYLAIGW